MQQQPRLTVDSFARPAITNSLSNVAELSRSCLNQTPPAWPLHAFVDVADHCCGGPAGYAHAWKASRAQEALMRSLMHDFPECLPPSSPL